MNSQFYAHRHADIILNSDYVIRKEIEDVIKAISYKQILDEYEKANLSKKGAGKKESKGRQSTLNTSFKQEFKARDWQVERSVFDSSDQDLKIDFWKRDV